MFRIDLTSQVVPRSSLRSSLRWVGRRVGTVVLAALWSLGDPFGEESTLE